MTLEGTVKEGVIILNTGTQLPEGTQVRIELAPGPVARSQLRSANIKYLSFLLQQLLELRIEPEQDEHGRLRASQHAFDAACNLLIDTAIIAALDGGHVPYGCVSTDSEGGVRIEWVRDAASVHLVVPASEERDAYTYHEEGPSYGTESASCESLARWLHLIKD